MKRDPVAFLREEINELKKNNLDWTIRYLEDSSKPHSIVDQKEVLMLNTNNYLGLATHPKVVQATIDAIKKYGAGAGAVPVIAGSFDLTKEFQEKFAKFKEVEASLLCQTGFAVNTGLIPQLVGKQDIVVSDELNHGSIIDGVRLSRAKRIIYKHTNVSDLENQLKEAEKEGARRILIITDGVFSMDGDMAPLPEIVKISEEFGAMVFVDDCHGEGVLGEGRGIVAHYNLQGKVHVEGGSMSKGFGVFGGTVAGSKDLIEFCLNKSRTYLLSTAHPPSVVAACIAVIKVVESEPEHVQRLWDHTNYFKKEVQSMGYNTGNSQTPIIPLIVGDPGKAQELARILFEEENIFTTPIVSRDDLNIALSAIEKVGRKLSII